MKEKITWCLLWILMMNVVTIPAAIFCWNLWLASKESGWSVETTSFISAVVLTLWFIVSICYAIHVEFFTKQIKIEKGGQMKLILASLIIAFCLAIPAADAKKGGGGTVNWECYYHCIALGGDRLECVTGCMR